jgi:hypothetical protein
VKEIDGGGEKFKQRKQWMPPKNALKLENLNPFVNQNINSSPNRLFSMKTFVLVVQSRT